MSPIYVARYDITDFGKEEYKDSLIPVQLLMILMGFSLLLYNRAVEMWPDYYAVVSVVCGATYLIGYMFYMMEYYERIWIDNYALPTDKTFFRIYVLAGGIIIITLMNNWPSYWYFYVLFLMLLMYQKKKDTCHHFQTAVRQKFGDREEDIAPPKLRALYVNAEVFTVNFRKWGVVFTILWSSALFYLDYSKESLGAYVGISVTITLVSVSFWISKIKFGLSDFAKKIEAGDHGFFRHKLNSFL